MVADVVGRPVPVSAVLRPTWQMPLQWSPGTALALRELAEQKAGLQPSHSPQPAPPAVQPTPQDRALRLCNCCGSPSSLLNPAAPKKAAEAESSSSATSSASAFAVVEGYSTPSTVDVGCASLRLRLGGDYASCCQGALASQGSLALGVRLLGGAWLPAVAGVPGHHADRAGIARHGLLEMVVMARPTQKGSVTFLHEDVLSAWAPVGTRLEVVPLHRVDDFHIDDGSGPWLRDRICITASQAEDFAAGLPARSGCAGADADLLYRLLRGSGLRWDAARVEAAPLDEWDLARQGKLHRDCVGPSSL
mmetsp:Transcript_85175/g.244493  ORF Transcript_85175/g.244493 Transcript_85175/m.244493 type:complete len:306 (-) Transcript_85175:45-962(-)